MSNYQEFVTRVRRELEEETATVWADESILDWANDAIFDLARKLRSMVDEQFTTAVSGQESYSLPTDTNEVMTVYYDTHYLTRIRPEEYYQLKSVSTSNGTPVHYAIINSDLYLHPAPDNSTSTIHFFRSYLPAKIASTTSTVEMPFGGKYNDALSYFIKARAWEQVPDIDQVNMNDGMYNRAAANAVFNELRDYTGDYFLEPVTIW